jgi:Transcriptional regulatory protein, C terminal
MLAVSHPRGVVPQTLQQILDERASTLVGRHQELTALGALLDDGGPLVAVVHGIAGIGKSTLVRAFAGRARARGASVLQLDASAIEPTERGFLAALAATLDDDGVVTLGDTAERLAGAGERVVLVVDTLERLRLLDDWLRQRFMPALPENVCVVLAGRDQPAPGWVLAFGDLVTVVPLANLARDEAEELLRRGGVPEPDLPRVNRLAHGHPLSLRLAASALAARPGLTLDEAVVPTLIDQLTSLYLGGLDGATRRALDAAAVVRRPTRALLAAMLGDDAADGAWRRLDELPFTETGPDGLVLHDTVRAAVDAALRADDPGRRRSLRAAAFGHLRAEARKAAPAELWRSTADLLFLVENPLVREGFFPTSAPSFAVEPAVADDQRSILDIVHRHHGDQSAAIIDTWWQAAPEGFRVARDRHGDIAAFLLLCEPAAAGARVIRRDPVAAGWREDLHRRSLPSEQRVLFVRCLLTRDAGESPGPAQAALWVDAKRVYMELRPDLRRVYVAVSRLDVFAPLLEPLGFTTLPGPPIELDGLPIHSLSLDFGPRSVDGWLAGLVTSELALDIDPRLDAGARTLTINGEPIALTKLEFELLRHLHQRSGKTVPRAELLRDVWGHKWQGGGNVIEVAVSGIRRKLGQHAQLIDTVRGIGYRWRDP